MQSPRPRWASSPRRAVAIEGDLEPMSLFKSFNLARWIILFSLLGSLGLGVVGFMQARSLGELRADLEKSSVRKGTSGTYDDSDVSILKWSDHTRGFAWPTVAFGNGGCAVGGAGAHLARESRPRAEHESPRLSS